MTTYLRYTLLCDGSSDRLLIFIIDWVFKTLYPEIDIEGSFADFRTFEKPPLNSDVKKRVQYAKEYYPFDILFYHRDAENNSKGIMKKRIDEISEKMNINDFEKAIFIIPIRMTESWLLIDESAIKKAAGNNNYNKKIKLPELDRLENMPDPKNEIYRILKEVSGKKGRQLDTFNVKFATHLVAEYIEDYSPLRNLSSFVEFENSLKKVVSKFLNK